MTLHTPDVVLQATTHDCMVHWRWLSGTYEYLRAIIYHSEAAINCHLCYNAPFATPGYRWTTMLETTKGLEVLLLLPSGQRSSGSKTFRETVVHARSEDTTRLPDGSLVILALRSCTLTWTLLVLAFLSPSSKPINRCTPSKTHVNTLETSMGLSSSNCTSRHDCVLALKKFPLVYTSQLHPLFNQHLQYRLLLLLCTILSRQEDARTPQISLTAL
jgi:hypothetical protein